MTVPLPDNPEPQEGHRVSQEYREYLRSDTWQRLRSKRLAIDEFRCQRCGTPYGPLQVHHLAYPEILGTENVYTDLVTLCKSCHELVEHNKYMFRKDKKDAAEEKYKYDMRRIYGAAKEMACYDLSSVGMGNRDYCNIDVVRADFGPILEDADLLYGYVERVITYFRNRRYRVILKMKNDGLSANEVIRRTGFSCKMVSKVFDNPEKAMAMIKNPKEEEFYYEQTE